MAIELWQRSHYFIQNVLEVIFRHPIASASIFAINSENQIVLTKRRDNQLWGLPGGMVKWGEDIPTTVRRELEEETGLKLIKINRLVGVYSSPDRDPRLHSICIAVEVLVEGTICPSDRQEIIEANAFSLDNLPQTKLAHDHDRQLQDYLNLIQGQPPIIA
jgi:ADP-ribose pyrophosphatase YjhB (NUDIX family)